MDQMHLKAQLQLCRQHTQVLWIIHTRQRTAQAQSCYKRPHHVDAALWLQGPTLHWEQLELLL